MGKHSKPEDITEIPEPRLVELRRESQTAKRPFVDPSAIAQCERVLDRRGETWAAAVLGRDISRRSTAVPHRPHLNAGEEHTLIAADQEEDRLAIAHLDRK
ncbi:hypothetical protein KL864_33975 [Mycolicibacterium goodii]|uniref:hypothetical protein n=1 Tax=Mycolicibacterium goodii TaxID=134601 RepID=UPI001BDC1C0D|nr:hypothetical protein [Mycolicibacterium goodii]MBU8820876.1 hypothetical protein [Mycolicibacterium goodii]